MPDALLDFRRLRAGLIALVAAVLGAATTIQAQDPHLVPVPPEAEVSQLGDRMRINGQEARLQELRYPGSVEALLSFYRQQFGDSASEPANTPGQRIVGGVVGGSYVTVQVIDEPERSANTPLHARVLQTRLAPQLQTEARRTLPSMPPDSSLLSDVESQDGPRLARMRVYGNRHSVSANVAFVEREFEARGLVPVERGADGDAAQALRWFADDRGGEALLAVRSAGETRLVTVHTVVHLAAFEEPR
ncbi:MAG TPA: hypothetical protein VFR90_04055 [Methylibium sp.]|uniref:hypothetical protein n=1 Tax=Methylibium sp. TaxID=2067992 RepID=UPI002DBA0034|nr:hypothetical protein [Methylibium sp.]HEU4458273.1 hypothetical protein [Methylibium sp.]